MAKTIEEFIQTISQNPTYKNSKARNGFDYLREYGEYIKQSVKNRTSPFLPDSNGEINLQPAYDIFNKRTALGYPSFKISSNLTASQKKHIFLKELENDTLKQILFLTKQKELNAPTPAFITFDSVQYAIKCGVKCSIPKGTHGITIPYFDSKNWGKINTVYYTNENGERVEKKRDTWFNISQIDGADALAVFCKERIAGKVSYDFANKPMEIEKTEKVTMAKNTVSSDVYLMQVMASMEEGHIIQVSPELAKKFSRDMLAKLSAFNKTINKPDETAIKKICDKTAEILNAYRFSKKTEKYQVNEKQLEKKLVVRVKTKNPYEKER